MFQEVRLRHGQSSEVRALLSRWVKKGKLKRLEQGVFRKTEA
jgi:predicted transcriptional regulator of viral defense system